MSGVADKVSRARLQLMLRNPYLAGAIARLPMKEAEGRAWCPTMATDGYNIFWNSDFCNSLNEEELSGVIAHELLHCILGHNDRRGERDRRLWNIAIDHATNLLLLLVEFKLPDGCLADRCYRGMTAEQIYDKLLDASRDQKITSLGALTNVEASSLEELTNKAQAFGGFDIHLEASDLEGSAERTKDLPTPIEKLRIRRELIKGFREKARGILPLNLVEEIERAGESETPWQAVMAQFMSGIRKDDYRLYPFNRKHVWRGLYLPSIGRPGPSHITVAVDTSGSMDRDLLGKVLAELDAIRTMTECKLTLIECDSCIQNVSEYEGWEIADLDFHSRPFKGRGGTNFAPVFKWMKEVGSYQNPSPEALIYLTDGIAPFPQILPAYYVLWVFPKDFDTKAPFGITLKAL